MRLSLGAGDRSERHLHRSGDPSSRSIAGRPPSSRGRDGTGTTVIARPLVSVFTGLEFAEATSFPGNAAFPFNYAVTTSVTTTTRFQAYERTWGRTSPGTTRPWFTPPRRASALSISTRASRSGTISSRSPSNAQATFLGNPFDFPTTLADYDSFRVSNKFYGGQIGGQYGLHIRAPIDLEAIAKVALGVTQQTATIDAGRDVPLLRPRRRQGAGRRCRAAILALHDEYMGSRSRETFSVVPELDLNAGWKITPRIEAHVGYSAPLLDERRPPRQPHRPHGQLQPDPGSMDPGFGMTPAAARARPTFIASQTNFWAQGFNFGFKYSF